MREREKNRFGGTIAEVVGALKPDAAVEERLYARSRRIRKKIAEFLRDHVGDVWEDLEDLHAAAANHAKCAAPTARRWILQYCRPEQPWQLVELMNGYTIGARLRIERGDRL